MPHAKAKYTHFTPEQVRKMAQPARRGDCYAWFASGGDGWGVDLEHGTIPHEIAVKLPPATVPNPIGNGGTRYRTHGEAMRALTTALDGVPFRAEFEDVGAGI